MAAADPLFPFFFGFMDGGYVLFANLGCVITVRLDD